MNHVSNSLANALRKRVSPGEAKLLLAACIGAFFGMVLSWSALQTLSWRTSVVQTDWTNAERWLVLSGTVVMGGLVLFMRKHFGHGGLLGLVRSVVGGVWILFLAGVITGTLNMPLWGTTFGVIIIATTLAKSPLVLLIAIATLGVVHWLCRPWQIERRSVFGYGELEF